MPWGAIVGSGWAGGLNIYATVFLLGMAGRLEWADTPTQLQSTAVLALAAGAYAVEFVADKIPYIDNAWDAAHTIIRPLGAAWLAGILSGDTTWTDRPWIAVGAALLALSSHSAKATTRAAVNVTPEPFSNIALSVAEDGIVAGMVTLALVHPTAAAVVALVGAGACIFVTFKLIRFAGRVFRPRKSVGEPDRP